jgi:hypothetical protein
MSWNWSDDNLERIKQDYKTGFPSENVADIAFLLELIDRQAGTIRNTLSGHTAELDRRAITIAEKDAEIERLEGENEERGKVSKSWRDQVVMIRGIPEISSHGLVADGTAYMGVIYALGQLCERAEKAEAEFTQALKDVERLTYNAERMDANTTHLRDKLAKERTPEFSQAQEVGAPKMKTWDDYRQGCLMTYGGGHRDDMREAFQHGMRTVFTLCEQEFPPIEKMIAAFSACADLGDDKPAARIKELLETEKRAILAGKTVDVGVELLYAAEQAHAELVNKMKYEMLALSECQCGATRSMAKHALSILADHPAPDSTSDPTPTPPRPQRPRTSPRGGPPAVRSSILDALQHGFALLKSFPGDHLGFQPSDPRQHHCFFHVILPNGSQ